MRLTEWGHEDPRTGEPGRPGQVVGIVDPAALADKYKPDQGQFSLIGTAFNAAKLALPHLSSNPVTAVPALVVFGALAIADGVRRTLNTRFGAIHEHIGDVHADLSARIDGVDRSIGALEVSALRLQDCSVLNAIARVCLTHLLAAMDITFFVTKSYAQLGCTCGMF